MLVSVPGIRRHALCPLSLAMLLWSGSTFATSALAASFTVRDGRADEEISETTRLYLDGNLVATFKLGPDSGEESRVVTLPDGPSSGAGAHRTHDYALCGEITVRNRSGMPEIHEVSSEGRLHDPGGRVLVALGARDFTTFFLADPDDPAAVEVSAGRSAVCQAPVS
ncbi:hypothetical protein [Rhizosaccharibacter radicis]|uniref:Uncharacterized protein n=1 Tax=Rhizosaccharibacter radicis TaxID=2782605 RepID=A0ABT1VWE8_9PROT|nr:hypothetical protein [Acetobacteraceae bacterium KSS12]